MIDFKSVNVFLKNLGLLSIYWAIFILAPGFVAFIYDINNIKFDLPGYLSFFVLFISPFIFAVPYKFARLNSKSQKILYIFIGLILPYAFIYLYLFISFKRDFHPSF